MKKIWSNPRGIELSNVGNASYWFGGEERYMLDKAELKTVADAIYKDLGLGWKKYIPGESELEIGKRYLVTRVRVDEAFTDHIRYFNDLDWADTKVIAFMDVAPYQPEDSHDIV